MESERISILLVEDNPGDVRIIREIMEGNKDCAHDLDCCGSISQAERVLDAKKFDVILLDLNLPDARGLEALEKISFKFPHIPIVVFTELDDNDLASQALKKGAQDFLVKGTLDCTTLSKSVLYSIERTKMHNEMRNLQLKQKAILDNIPDMAWIKDNNGRYLIVNNAFYRMSLFKSEDVVGKTDLELWPKALAKHYRIDDDKVMRSGTHKLIEESLIDKDGITKYVETIKSPLYNEKNEIVGTTGIARDITERKEYLQRMMSAEKLASVGTLAYGIAHEFNNILAIMMANAELGKISPDSSQIKECFNTILESSKRASGITRNLLAFARKEKITREPMNPVEPLKSVLSITRGELEKSKIKVVEKFASVPDVKCDSGELAEVFLNIVTNARDAMLPKGGILTITVEQRGKFDAIIFSDTGCGIPDDIKSTIFEPFVTSKGPLGKSDIPGTGLGLFLAYGIINSYKGKIEVDSEMGKGATFTILIPVSEEQSVDAGKPAKPGKKFPGRKLKILLIDDEKLILSMLANFLRSKGHDVTAVERGNEGIKLFGQGGFDLIVSDIIMPDMDGVELIKAVRSKDPTVKIIAITGYLAKEKELKARQAGADEVLFKPFKTSQFYETIARMVV